MENIDSIFPDRTLGYGYRKDDTFRKDGADWLIDYENQGELVYRIRLGDKCVLEEYHDGQRGPVSYHNSVGKAFLHHGLAVYGFGRREGLPFWERRLLSRLPEGSYGQVFSPGWQEEPLEIYYPDGILRRILIPAWKDPKGIVQRLVRSGVPEASILEIPDATLAAQGQDGKEEIYPCYLVHAFVFAREVVPVVESLSSEGFVGPTVPRRPILLYAHGLRWPGTLSFPGLGDPIQRFVFSLPRGLREALTERLREGVGEKARLERGEVPDAE